MASERNLKIQIVIGILAIVAGFFFQLTTFEWIAVVLCISSVISAELLNTAIEKTVDLLQPEFHEIARRAKDFAAAGVLVVSIGAAVVGCLIYVPHCVTWVQQWK